ncbi:MAG: hydroxymyristoyl-ACP dehydratase [Bacteroidales bacterium]|nr:hydroxymyristoyl-ACP dehydratase [Bacteroidales bacterium]
MAEKSFSGEEIKLLIPQRSPMMQVDFFQAENDLEGNTSLTIAGDNLFCSGGLFREPGLIEHIAQSAAAYAGYDTFRRGEAPKLGFIGEVKKMKIGNLPKVGDTVRTHYKVLGSADGVTLLGAESKVGDEVVASGRMKIFIKQ